MARHGQKFEDPPCPNSQYIGTLVYTSCLGAAKYVVGLLNGWQLAKMKKSIPDMSLS